MNKRKEGGNTFSAESAWSSVLHVIHAVTVLSEDAEEELGGCGGCGEHPISCGDVHDGVIRDAPFGIVEINLERGEGRGVMEEGRMERKDGERKIER